MNCSGRFGGCSLSLSLKEASALGIFLVVALLGWYLVGIVKAVFLDCFLSSWTQTNSTNDCIHMYVCLAWVYVCAWLACVYESTSIDNVYIRRKSEREQEKRDFLWVRVCMCELLDVVCVWGEWLCICAQAWKYYHQYTANRKQPVDRSKNSNSKFPTREDGAFLGVVLRSAVDAD